MSMCSPCKRAADETADRRESGNGMIRLHACAYPHTCTCQHDRREPARAGPGGGEEDMTDPEPGTTRYLCHLEEVCDWHYDVPPPSLDDLAGIVPEPGPETMDHFLNSVIKQAAVRLAKQTDAALRDHLSGHTLDEFVEVVYRLRTEARKAKVNAP